MAKQTLPEQHQALHMSWPDDCCLCAHETKIAQLEVALTTTQRLLEAARTNTENEALYKAYWNWRWGQLWQTGVDPTMGFERWLSEIGPD